MAEQTFDVVVVGAGPAGEVLAGRWIEVDDRMRVAGRPWLYAIGNGNGRSLLTHMGKYEASSRTACATPTRSEIWLKLLERYEAERAAGALAPAA